MSKKNQNNSRGHDIEFLDEDGELIDIVHFSDKEYKELESAAKQNGVSTLQYIVNALERYVEENNIQ